MTEKDLRLVNHAIKSLENIKINMPLVNCITNTVTVNDCANAILAVGGSPAMAEDLEDVAEFVKIANSLVINMGKLNKERIDVIFKACKFANENKIPIIIDPVGVGITNLRNKIIVKLIEEYTITAIRGNMSEIKTIANIINLEEVANTTINIAKGVDASEKDIITKQNLNENSKIVKALARKINTVIIASGPIDIVSNGLYSYGIENGDFMMSKITGSGCMLSSIIGAFIGANEALIGSVTATLMMGIAGENAGKYVENNNNNNGTGTFRTKLIDYLYLFNENDMNMAKLYEIKYE